MWFGLAVCLQVARLTARCQLSVHDVRKELAIRSQAARHHSIFRHKVRSPPATIIIFLPHGGPTPYPQLSDKVGPGSGYEQWQLVAV